MAKSRGAPVSVRWRSFNCATFWSGVVSVAGRAVPMLLTSPPAQKAVPAPVISQIEVNPIIPSEEFSENYKDYGY